MSEPPFAISIEEMYGDPGLDDAAIAAILARSFDPRPSMRPCAQARGAILNEQTFATELLEPNEAARLYPALGRTLYENELANCHWGVYQMLGKLAPQCITLQKS